MKKGIVILSSVFYLLVSVGIGYNMHYCEGNLFSVELYAKSSVCCCEGGQEMENDCCVDESSFFQFAPDQKLAANTNVSVKKMSLLANLLFDIQHKVADDGKHIKNAYYFDLPPPDSERIYLLNCSFVFYG